MDKKRIIAIFMFIMVFIILIIATLLYYDDKYSVCFETGTDEIILTQYVKKNNKVEVVKSTSLPIGVVSDLEIEQSKYFLSDGDMVVMVTDGVMDALPVGEQEFIMKMIIEGTQKTNPKDGGLLYKNGK